MDGLYNSPEKHTLVVMTRPGCPQVEGESPWILNINLEISEVWEKVWVSFLQKTDDSALSWVRALEGIAGVCVLVFTLVYACKSGPTVNRITSPHLPVLRWASGASYLSGNPHRSVIKTGNHLKPPGNYNFSRICSHTWRLLISDSQHHSCNHATDISVHRRLNKALKRNVGRKQIQLFRNVMQRVSRLEY